MVRQTGESREKRRRPWGVACGLLALVVTACPETLGHSPSGRAGSRPSAVDTGAPSAASGSAPASVPGLAASASPSPASEVTPALEPARWLSLPVVGIRVRAGAYAPATPSLVPAGTELRPWRTSVSTVAGTGAPGHADGASSAARFDLPGAIVVAPDGALYVTEVGGLRVRRIGADGWVSTVAGDGLAGYLDGPGTSARFNHPLGVARDLKGGLLVTDASTSVLRSVAADGRVSTFAGIPFYGFRNGPAASAVFSYPTGVAVSAAGILIADFSNSRVRLIDDSGNVSTFAGSGMPGYVDGAGTGAAFSTPVDVAVGNQGEVFVSDLLNHAVRVVDGRGEVRTLAGQGVPGFADGPGEHAAFSFPVGLAAGDDGNIFVADWGNNRVRRIDPAGAVSTLAGGEGAGFADGEGSTAHFNGPRGVAVSPDGDVFVADQQGHRIRRVRILARD